MFWKSAALSFVIQPRVDVNEIGSMPCAPDLYSAVVPRYSNSPESFPVLEFAHVGVRRGSGQVRPFMPTSCRLRPIVSPITLPWRAWLFRRARKRCTDYSETTH